MLKKIIDFIKVVLFITFLIGVLVLLYACKSFRWTL